ncbi:hypothetical protein ASPWEDRAFT_724725 [Aspergillus wentii DTO 134E9]|uniref:Secreted protein n=1 Tax=Aspergillus wentii DTO 134E9 TaxID=1073089 RepID=A0A1L9R722_ASPWE|nr:uncharacterized protein ASPWEDRAFT_724725 [Aspergillus wentii DTO 134E9]OJJ30687.1 hypothetical protein ASPWEDRAFT_724725 [Aspergillus wentii DTO 134E9]
MVIVYLQWIMSLAFSVPTQRTRTDPFRRDCRFLSLPLLANQHPAVFRVCLTVIDLHHNMKLITDTVTIKALPPWLPISKHPQNNHLLS